MAEPATTRHAPLAMDPAAFRALGHDLVDALADFLAGLPARPVAPGSTPEAVRAALGAASLPEEGTPAGPLLAETLALLAGHQAFNGHPRFWGYITAAPAPIGILADFLASALNPNVGLWRVSPVATELELQTARWIAELIGYPVAGEVAGVMSSGGQTANFIGFLAARRARAPWDVRANGVGGGGGRRLRVYATAEAHAWLPAAADLFGLGKDALRRVPTGTDLAMDPAALESMIAADRAGGDVPMLVVGTAGTVATGAIDPLPEIAAVCREHGAWFHVDAAYGGFAAVLPDAPPALRGLAEADSVAVDPHKWLYAPIDVGCTLVRDPQSLRAAFSARPSYYDGAGDPDAPIDLFEWGPENSRRLRALKVWLALRQVGRAGYERMIADDIDLAGELFDRVRAHPALEARTLGLSIATFRYVPPDLRAAADDHAVYLDDLNRALLRRVQDGGEVFVSNAVVGGRFLLRACIVNFRTTAADVAALPAVVAAAGAALDVERRGMSAGCRGQEGR